MLNGLGVMLVASLPSGFACFLCRP
jgi:hypothetical protein